MNSPDVDSPAPTLDPDILLGIYGRPIFYKSSGGAPKDLNERFFAARFFRDDHVRFDSLADGFYQYQPLTGLWQRRSDDRIRESVAEHVMAYGAKRGVSLDSLMTTKKLGPIVGALRGICADWEPNTRARDHVHVSNGVVRFLKDGTAKLTDYRMEDYSRNRAPIDYLPAATCPRFLNQLLYPSLGPDDASLIQRMFGNIVAGVNPCQRMFLLVGGSGTGKSTLAIIARLLAGAANAVQLRTSFLNERFEAFRFVDRTLLIASDVKGDFLDHPAAGALKSFVGGDPMTAEGKQSNTTFDIKGCYNVLITSNSRLVIHLDGDAGAWKRRLTIIRFENPPTSHRIADFGEVLMAEEGPGILNWALEGFRKSQQEALETGDVILTPEQHARVDKLLAESDSVRFFIQRCTARGDGDATSGELAEAYYAFCKASAWIPQPQKVFERSLGDAILEAHGISQSHDIHRDSKARNGWRHLLITLPPP